MNTPDNISELINELLQKRNETWAGFDYRRLPSSQNNGWPDFASANHAWLQAGGAPRPGDEIERISGNYYRWYRYERKHYETEVPDWVWSDAGMKEDGKTGVATEPARIRSERQKKVERRTTKKELAGQDGGLIKVWTRIMER